MPSSNSSPMLQKNDQTHTFGNKTQVQYTILHILTSTIYPAFPQKQLSTDVQTFLEINPNTFTQYKIHYSSLMLIPLWHKHNHKPSLTMQYFRRNTWFPQTILRILYIFDCLSLYLPTNPNLLWTKMLQSTTWMKPFIHGPPMSPSLSLKVPRSSSPNVR